MLDEIQAAALLCLIGCHYFLIRGCFGIKDELPITGESISDKIGKTSDLLDEIAQIMSDFADSIEMPKPHTPSSPVEAILTSFISRMNMGSSDSNGKKESEWEILPNQDNTQTTQTETIIDGNSPVSADSGRSD